MSSYVEMLLLSVRQATYCPLIKNNGQKVSLCGKTEGRDVFIFPTDHPRWNTSYSQIEGRKKNPLNPK